MKDYLIISRSKWVNGSNSGAYNTSALLNNQGNMCCLGFRCHQMGIPKKELLFESNPQDLADKWDIPGLLEPIGGDDPVMIDSQLTYEAIEINDDNDISNSVREEKLIELFANHGITVEFKGRYKPLNTKEND